MLCDILIFRGRCSIGTQTHQGNKNKAKCCTARADRNPVPRSRARVPAGIAVVAWLVSGMSEALFESAQALLTGYDTAVSKQWREEDRRWRQEDLEWRRRESEQMTLDMDYM